MLRILSLLPVAVAAVFGLAAPTRPAMALSFNFSVYQNDTLSLAQAAAFNTAAAAWSALLHDDITVNVQIGFRDLGGNVLGSTSPSFGTDTAANVFLRLALDAKDGSDAQAVASLPAPAGLVSLTTAQAKAIGYVSAGFDGIIEFTSNAAYTFSTSRDGNGAVAGNTFDLIGIAEHEIGHLLGFISSIDEGNGILTLLDEFRYAANGSRQVTSGVPAYFSINGAVTAGTPQFSDGVQRQASHWLTGTGSIMDPTFAPGEVRNISGLDVLAMDAIGYDVPEPASIALFALGLGAAALGRRRRAPQASTR